MRKLSILIALILCVTIGGVYATWTYPGNSIGNVSQDIGNNMAAVTFEGAYGEYNVQSNTLALVIDKAANSYDTELKYEGSLVFTFTPHDNIDGTQLAAALGATVSVTGADLDLAKYEGNDIWQLAATPSFTLNAANNGDWTYTNNNNTKIYTCEIECSELEEIITMARVFTLNNHSAYHTFDEAQERAVFKIHVTAATVAAHS